MRDSYNKFRPACLLGGVALLLGACSAAPRPSPPDAPQVAVSAPAHAAPARPAVPPPADPGQWAGYREQRQAVSDGLAAHGRRTASGELHDVYAPTAAHPSLPPGVYAELAAPASGRRVVVRINDRSPDGLLRLSHAAALKLGLGGRGGPQPVWLRVLAPARGR